MLLVLILATLNLSERVWLHWLEGAIHRAQDFCLDCFEVRRRPSHSHPAITPSISRPSIHTQPSRIVEK
jgi:hypothetical protein